MFIPIKVNGRGLIPRGHGLAPKSFVKADMQLVQLIFNTPGLTMEYIQPDVNTLVHITRTNYREIFAKHEAMEAKKFAEASKTELKFEKPVEKPIEKKEEPKPTPIVVTPPKVEEKKEESPVEEKIEEKKDDFSFKPVHKEEQKPHHNNNPHKK